ncbi:MAG: DUF3293 domain-containing protein [Methylococcales bacterium]
MTQDLWEIYQTTCFVLPEKTNLLQARLCRNFAIISARNPESKEQSLYLNLQAEKTMKQWLNKRSYDYKRIYGCSPSFDYVEPSLLIDMPDKTCAIEAAAAFRQNALFWVSDNQLYLVSCSQISNAEVNLGVFSKRLIQANLILNKANT